MLHLWLMLLLVIWRLMKLVVMLVENLSLLCGHKARGGAGELAIALVSVAAAADAKRQGEAGISQAEKGGLC